MGNIFSSICLLSWAYVPPQSTTIAHPNPTCSSDLVIDFSGAVFWQGGGSLCSPIPEITGYFSRQWLVSGRSVMVTDSTSCKNEPITWPCMGKSTSSPQIPVSCVNQPKAIITVIIQFRTRRFGGPCSCEIAIQRICKKNSINIPSEFIGTTFFRYLTQLSFVSA